MSLFRKPLTLSSRTPLKGSAVKKLKDSLKKAFPSLTDDMLADLFPAKAVVTVDKLTNHMLIYYINKEEPLFFDLTNGKGELFPTVYALWKQPNILPCLTVKWQTSKPLLRGADLMAPGLSKVQEETRGMKKDEKRCVCVEDNPAPFAVGVTLLDGAQTMFQQKGKVLSILHCFGDFLWSYGHEKKNQEIFLPDGYFHNVVVSLKVLEAAANNQQELLSGDEEDVDSEAPEAKTEDDSSVEAEAKSSLGDTSIDAEAKSSFSFSSASTDAASEQTEEVQQTLSDLSLSETAVEATKDENEEQTTPAPEAEETEEKSGISQEEMDAAITRALHFAIKTVLSDSSIFPLSPSLLLNTYMEQCNPYPFSLSLKTSSWKKMAKFLKEMEKQNLLKIKEKKGQESVVVSVNYNHPSVKQITEQQLKEVEKQVRQKQKQQEKQRKQKEADNSQQQDQETCEHLQVLLLYKPDNALLSIPTFDETTIEELLSSSSSSTTSNDLLSEYRSLKSGRSLMTLQEARAKLMAYVDQLQQQTTAATTTTNKKSGAVVPVDAALARAFFSQQLKQGQNIPETITKQQLAKELEQHLQVYHCVVLDARLPPEQQAREPRWLRGIPVGIQVCLDTRKTGKKNKMTKIKGLEAFGLNPVAIAREAQRKFACSATTAEVTENQQTKTEVLIQGNICDELVQWLHKEKKVPQAHIHVVS